MSEPIGPGDIVECIDNKSRLYPGTEKILTIGTLYTVKKVGLDKSNKPCCRLVEVRGVNKTGTFLLDRFRPIKKFRPGSFDYLLKQPVEA